MLKNGDKIQLTWLPPCRNGNGSPNPYIGSVGIVYDYDSKTGAFSLEMEKAWLIVSCTRQKRNLFGKKTFINHDYKYKVIK